MHRKIIITGFGGQGVVLAGRIIGQAAAIGDQRESTLVQSYGPESRGGECSAQVTIADEAIHFPYIQTPDILVCLSQTGYQKYCLQTRPETVLIIDSDLVTPSEHTEYFAIPCTRFAEEMGLKMAANIIMIGFWAGITSAVSVESLRNTVAQSVPKGTEEKNIKAFDRGLEFAQATLKSRSKRAAGQTGVAV